MLHMKFEKKVYRISCGKKCRNEIKINKLMNKFCLLFCRIPQ